jgi:hypothetical protein
MPLERIIKAGKKMYDEYQSQKTKGPDPEIPVPGRQRVAAPPPPKVTNQSRANVAADALRIPGRDVIRGAMVKRKKMLDEM